MMSGNSVFDPDAHPVSQTETVVSKYWGKHVWKIKEFSSYHNKPSEQIGSARFSTYGTDVSGPGGQCKGVLWEIRLYPRGVKEDYKDSASIYVFGMGPLIKRGKLDATCTISIGKKKDGTELFGPVEVEHQFYNEEKGYQGFGLVRAFPRKVNDNNRDMLEGEFVITCVVQHTGIAITRPITDDNPSPNSSLLDPLPLYRDGVLTDIELSVDGRVFRAHKLVLASKSPVFYRMLTGDFTESSTNIIPIRDIGAETCKLMLDHIYGERFVAEGLSAEQGEELLYASEKYEINSLKAQVESLLASKVGCKTVANLLVVSDKYKAVSLKRSCHEYIESHWRNKKICNWDTIMLHHAHIIAETATIKEEYVDDDE